MQAMVAPLLLSPLRQDPDIDIPHGSVESHPSHLLHEHHSVLRGRQASWMVLSPSWVKVARHLVLKSLLRIGELLWLPWLLQLNC